MFHPSQDRSWWLLHRWNLRVRIASTTMIAVVVAVVVVVVALYHNTNGGSDFGNVPVQSKIGIDPSIGTYRTIYCSTWSVDMDPCFADPSFGGGRFVPLDVGISFDAWIVPMNQWSVPYWNFPTRVRSTCNYAYPPMDTRWIDYTRTPCTVVASML